MIKSTKLTALALLASAFAAAQADITSYSANSFAEATQYYSTMGTTYLSYASGPPCSFRDPYTVIGSGAEFTGTAGQYFDAVTVSTPTYLQIDASFVGFALAASATNYDQAEAFGYSTLNFTLNQPGKVTLKTYNTTVAAPAQGALENIMYLDGIYYLSSAADGFASVDVAAGTHYGFVEGQAYAYSGSIYGYGDFSQGQLTADYRITVTSTPEPCTLAILGLASILGLRNRIRAPK